MKINKKVILKSFLFFVFLSTAFLTGVSKVSADTPYNPSLLIDDNTFSNSSSMSPSTIQNFLNVMGSGIANYSAIEACNPTSPVLPDPYANSYYPNCGQTVSAATIIYDASQAYGVNPEVILSTIQKEQSLVTDPSPTQGAIDCAMGYDSCNGGFDTFFSQIDNGTWQLRTDVELMDGNNWWGYTPSNYPCATAGYGTFYNSSGQQTSMQLYSAGLFPNSVVTFSNPAVYAQVNGSWQLSGGESPPVPETLDLLSSATAALYCYTPYVGPINTTGYSGSYNFVNSMYTWFSYPSQVYIPNGTYNIVGSSSGKNIDVRYDSNVNGTPVQLYYNDGTGAQQWQFTRDSDGYYSIENIGTGKYLDEYGAGFNSGTPVDIWDGNNTCAQQWAIQAVGSSYMILNSCSGLPLDATGGSTSNGTPIQVYTANYTGAQLWNLNSISPAPIVNGFYTLTTTAGTALDIPGGSNVSGTNLQIYANNGAGAEQWQFIVQSNGLYQIRNPQSGKYLDVIGASTAPSTHVDIWDGNNTCAQEWAITPNSNGTYALVSSCSGLNLDVWGDGVNTNGTPVDVYTNNGTGAQEWTLAPISSIPLGLYSLTTTAGTALDIPGGSTLQGTQLQIYSKNGTGAQEWQILSQGNGYYVILNPQSGKYLDVIGASHIPGTHVDIYGGNGTCAQQWSITPNTNGTYALVSSCSGLNLDVWGDGVNTNGTPVDVYTNNGTGAQEWTLAPSNTNY